MTLAALLAFAMLAVAFAANATAFNSTKQKFKAEIKGVQTFTSDYDHVSTDVCDPTISSHTKETIKFASTKPIVVTFTRIPGVKDPYITAGDRGVRFPTKARVTRSHSHSASKTPIECGDNGGGVPGGPIVPDCGTKTVTPWYMSVDYVYGKKGKVELQPEDNAGSDLFEHCGTGMYPRLLPADSFGKSPVADLPASEVFDPKIGKLITIGRGKQFIAYPEGGDGTTIKWELSLTRLGGKG
jgi:hypothetical protein